MRCVGSLWAICTAASLPALWYHFYLDQKFGLTKSRLSTWLLDSLKGKGLAFILGGAIVEIAFVSHKLSPAHGWLWAGVLCSLLFLGMIQLFPWLLSLFYPAAPLKNDPLQQRLNRLAMKAGVRVGIISEWRISGRTRQANALVAGIGTSRRILLTDTLIAELSEDEVEAIVGHELGHCALHHVSQRVALQGVMFCGIFWLINLAVDNGLMLFVSENSNWFDLRLLPGFFLFWSCGYIYCGVILAVLARRQEKAADLYCWKLVARVEPFITAMRKITDLNLMVFDKNSEWKYSHPSTSDRIAAAEQYGKAHGQ